jgi:hypothetical protein
MEPHRTRPSHPFAIRPPSVHRAVPGGTYAPTITATAATTDTAGQNPARDRRSPRA